MKRALLFLTLAGFAVGGAVGFQSYSPVLTGGTVANFEGFGEFTRITTQYAGMTFSQTGSGAPMIDNYQQNAGGQGCSGAAWCFGYGADSGSGVLTGSLDGNDFPTVAGIIVSFTSLQSTFQTFLSDTAPLGDYTITAFDDSHSVLGTVTVLLGNVLPPGYGGGVDPAPGTFPLPGLFVGFTDSLAEIRSVQIGPSSASSDAFSVDDVSIGGSVAGVPEPATWTLLGAGLALVSVRRLRAR